MPDREHFGEKFPEGREYRKYWEVAMTARAFRDLGVLEEEARVLGVGAGHEATIYWLTTQVGGVVATDLYEADDVWSETDSSAAMLTDPGRFWDGPWDPDRLEVRNMNALELDFPDDSSTVSSRRVRSSTSAASGKSGGASRRSTGCCGREASLRWRPSSGSQGSGHGWPGVYLFDEAALRAAIFDGLWWDPATPPGHERLRGDPACPRRACRGRSRSRGRGCRSGTSTRTSSCARAPTCSPASTWRWSSRVRGRRTGGGSRRSSHRAPGQGRRRP